MSDELPPSPVPKDNAAETDLQVRIAGLLDAFWSRRTVDEPARVEGDAVVKKAPEPET